MKAIKLAYLAMENPQEYEGRRFKVVKGSRFVTEQVGYYECIVRNGSLVTHDVDEYDIAVFDDTEVEEIPQYIPFMDAMETREQMDKGCFFCDYNGNTKRYVGTTFTAVDGTPVTYSEILHGKWYVK